MQNKNNEKNKKVGTSTGQAAPISNLVKASTVNQPIIKSEKSKSSCQKFSGEIRAKFRTKNNENNKRLNRILNFHNPNSNLENGHWVTMNGAHFFIEDK